MIRFAIRFFRRGARYFVFRGGSIWRLSALRLLTDNLEIPLSVTIAKGVSLSTVGKGRIVVGPGSSLGAGVRLIAGNGRILIGRDVFIGPGTIIVAREEVWIGDDSQIAEYVTIRDQDHSYRGGALTRESGFDVSAIKIGQNVWIGAKSSVLRGVSIGAGAVIGAHSLVKRSIPANSVAFGAPARVVKEVPDAEGGTAR